MLSRSGALRTKESSNLLLVGKTDGNSLYRPRQNVFARGYTE